MVAAVVFFRSATSFRVMFIQSLSRVEILVLLTVRSRQANKWLTLLPIAKSYFVAWLVWLPGHHGIVGNNKAHEFAEDGVLTPILWDWERFSILLRSCVLGLDLWSSPEFGKRWSITGACAAAISHWSRVERKRPSNYLLIAKVFWLHTVQLAHMRWGYLFRRM